MSAGAVERFSDDDDSADTLRSKFLVAGLAGLGRLDANAAASAASDLSVDLGKQTRWSRAIMAAAERREPGMVALLAAAGMQGEWSQLPPYHRSEEHTSELQSLMRTSYAVFGLKKKKTI